MNTGNHHYTTSKETSKILRQLTTRAGRSELLIIPHKGARRSLCLQAIRKTYTRWLDAEFTQGLKKINLESIPIKQAGEIIGYL